MLYDTSYKINFASECIVPSDCPNGGTNYKCNANKCECAPGLVLDGDSCVGMLHIRLVAQHFVHMITFKLVVKVIYEE